MAKPWILRLIGIPVTILIPMLGANAFMDGCARLIGDINLIFVSIPALITILWATFRMADWIVFASRADLWPFHLFRVMRSEQKCVKERRWTRKHGKSCWA